MSENLAPLFERIDRIDRRVNFIGRAIILIETLGMGWLFYAAAAYGLELAPGWSILIAIAAGLMAGTLSQRAFDR